jgi:hypothetical protein
MADLLSNLGLSLTIGVAVFQVMFLWRAHQMQRPINLVLVPALATVVGALCLSLGWLLTHLS